jgi:ADP-ribose pyrophosphatase YjhB (NUDIX family)
VPADSVADVEFRTFADVFLLLVLDGNVLLALRQNTGYADGQWNLPSGKVEPDEDLAAALRREAREEVGVEVIGTRLATVVHHRAAGEEARLGFFFEATDWAGEPRNAEPGKCGGIGWYPLDALPAETVPYTAVGVELYRRGEPYSRHGAWR